FYLYDVASFLTNVKKFKNARVPDSAIDEARALPPRPKLLGELSESLSSWNSLVATASGSPIGRVHSQLEILGRAADAVTPSLLATMAPFASSLGVTPDVLRLLGQAEEVGSLAQRL